MRVIVQRVKNAKVVINGNIVADIKRGLLLFVGVGKGDTEEDIKHICKKVSNLRIFEDNHNKMNLDIKRVKGEILSVPQFTLYADTRRGNRPGFEESAAPVIAKEFWKKFNDLLRQNDIVVKEGVFGAHMDIELANDGPVTIWFDSENR